MFAQENSVNLLALLGKMEDQLKLRGHPSAQQVSYVFDRISSTTSQSLLNYEVVKHSKQSSMNHQCRDLWSQHFKWTPCQTTIVVALLDAGLLTWILSI